MKLSEQNIIVCPRCEGNKMKILTNKSLAGSVALFSFISMVFIITLPFAVMGLIASFFFLFIPYRVATCQECKHTHKITMNQVKAFKEFNKFK